MNRLEKAINYIRGYCNKHTNCKDCQLVNFDNGFCLLDKECPSDWKTQDEYFEEWKKKVESEVKKT